MSILVLTKAGKPNLKAAIPLPDQDTLHRLLDYNPETGILTWKARPDKSGWTKRWAGKPALESLVHGYRHGTIESKSYRTHRVIWKWMTGEEPIEVDHINGRRDDNRWSNLRSVSRTQNGRNTGIGSKNTSGIKGVAWDKRKNRWYARAMVDRKEKFIGYYGCKTAAHIGRISFLDKIGFTDRHLGVGG